MDPASAELFALLDCVPTPIFVLDVKAGDVPVYAHYNKTALLKMGCALSDILGKTVIEAFGAEFGAAAYHEQRRTITSRTQRKYEFQLPVGNEVRVVRTTLTPQMDDSGAVVRLIGSSLDVSVEWIAQTTQAKLANIGTEVEQFVAMAAHDLRTPMRNVMSLTEMLEEGFVDKGDGKIDLINMLKQTSEKSLDLITDVLSYASIMGPQTEATLYSLSVLGSDVMQTLDPQKDHKLTTTNITLAGEKNVMQIVLRNLIDNAIKHGNRSHMQLACHARMIRSDMVEITVADDGQGFDNPGTVFLDTGEFRVDSGYGLLAVRKLILGRGGTIAAGNDSVTGGSSIRFTLPHRQVCAQTAPSYMAKVKNGPTPPLDALHTTARL